MDPGGAPCKANYRCTVTPDFRRSNTAKVRPPDPSYRFDPASGSRTCSPDGCFSASRPRTLPAAVAPVVVDPVPPPQPAGPAGSRRYKVRRGDTLVGIVRKLRCSSVQEVAEMNHLRHHHIAVGQVLKVPECR